MSQSVVEYIHEVRIRKAKELLIQTEKTVQEISGSVGFANIQHFHRLFKRLTGVTPNEYRKTRREIF